MILKVKENNYNVRFTYNSFCDTDLMERTEDLLQVFHGAKAENDTEVRALGKLKELFSCVRDLLYVGFQKDSPVENVQAVGDILDDWLDEATDGEKRGIFNLFTELTNELMGKGFLSEVVEKMAEAAQNTKTPQDHKKPQK